MTDRVQEILSHYPGENPGVLTNLARMLNHGTLAGTGKLVVLPVDQKLIDVEWSCHGTTCEPWFLTRVMKHKDVARSHVFTDRDKTIIVHETRKDGIWDWEQTEVIELPPKRKLFMPVTT